MSESLLTILFIVTDLFLNNSYSLLHERGEGGGEGGQGEGECLIGIGIGGEDRKGVRVGSSRLYKFQKLYNKMISGLKV